MTKHPRDEFMSRVMSNLDGNKDAKIASLTAALRAVAAARMPGQARRIALEALAQEGADAK